MHPAILHADVDAFYASVAQRDDPELRGRPVAVGSWVVMAASYEARAYGVRGGMATSRARRLCPDLVFASPGWEAFSDASRAVFAIFERCTSIVEPGSMEEAFLDVSACDEPAVRIAERLRREVREEAGLPLSVGVARRKVLAKIASRSAKPDGLYVVEPERELEFLHALPVERIWGVGPATTRKLNAHGLQTVRQAAQAAEEDLIAILGPAAGRYVHAIAHNREHRPVRRRRGRRSFGAQRALGRSPRTRERRRAGAPRSRRARRRADAAQGPRRAHRRPAPALRRLHARDALLHPAVRDGRPAAARRGRARAAPRGAAASSSAAGSRSSA